MTAAADPLPCRPCRAAYKRAHYLANRERYIAAATRRKDALIAERTAFLVEFFPAKIRYTSMSLPYHLGNGEFGGWTPFIATAIVAWAHTSGNPWIKDHAIHMGLIWPISVALMTFFIGSFFLNETKDVKIWDEVGGVAAAD